MKATGLYLCGMVQAHVRLGMPMGAKRPGSMPQLSEELFRNSSNRTHYGRNR